MLPKRKVGASALAGAFLLFITGCGGVVAGRAYKDLDREQIDAVRAYGARLVGCLGVGGPPVGGATQILIVPNHATARVIYAPNCQLQEAVLLLQLQASD